MVAPEFQGQDGLEVCPGDLPKYRCSGSYVLLLHAPSVFDDMGAYAFTKFGFRVHCSNGSPGIVSITDLATQNWTLIMRPEDFSIHTSAGC